MEQLTAFAQISILLLVAFLIGILMAWMYWRRKYADLSLEKNQTKDQEIQRLSNEIAVYSNILGGKSPKAFKTEKEKEILVLKSKIDSGREEEKKKAAEFTTQEEKIKGLEAQLANAQESLDKIKGDLHVLEVGGIKLNPGEFKARKEAELEAKEAELFQLKKQLKGVPTTAPDSFGLAESLGNMRWDMAEKDQGLIQMQQLLEEKRQSLNKLQAEIGEWKFVDMDGVEQGPLELIAQMRSELQAKEAEIERLSEAVSVQPASTDTTLVESLGKMRWEMADTVDELGRTQEQLGEKEQALRKLQAEIGEWRFVDIDGVEQGPLELIAQMRSELQAKEAEIERLSESVSVQPASTDTTLVESLGKMRWEMADTVDELGRTQEQLGEKEQALRKLQAEIGEWRFVDIDGVEQGPLELIAQMRSELQAKEAEIEQLSQQQDKIGVQVDSELAESLGKLRWEMADKEDALMATQSQLVEKAQALTSLQVELGQLKFIDEDGIENGPEQVLGQLREELEGQKQEMEDIQAELSQIGVGSITELREYVGRLKWAIAEKTGKEIGLSVPEEGHSADPSKDAEMERRLTDAEVEVLRLKGALAELHLEGKSYSPAGFVQHFQDSQQQFGTLLSEKELEIAGLRAELGQFHIVDDEGEEKGPAEFIAELREEMELKQTQLDAVKREKRHLGIQDSETFIEFFARQNLEKDAIKQELNKIQGQLAPLTYQGVAMLPAELIQRKEEELAVKDQEISHLLDELSQLHWEGVQMRPVDFTQKVKGMLDATEAEVQQLKAELEKLKYVSMESAAPFTPAISPHETAPPVEELAIATDKEFVLENGGNTSFSPQFIDREYVDVIPAEISELLRGYQNEGISLSNHDGYFLIFNDKLQELTEYSKGEANDNSEKIFLEKIYPDPTYRTEVAKQIEGIPEDGSFNSIYTTITTKHGKKRDLNVSSTTFYHKGMKYYLSTYVEQTQVPL